MECKDDNEMDMKKQSRDNKKWNKAKRNGGRYNKLGRCFAYLILVLENLPDETLHGARDMVDVLRFDGGLHSVLEDLGEVVLKLGSTKVDEDLLPVGWVVESAKVRLHLTGQDF